MYTASAAAERDEAVEEITEEIRVEAPRMVERERLPFGRGERVSLSYSVTHTDLDLAQEEDVAELEERVHVAASEICEQLETLFPVGEPDARTCAVQAADEAMEQAQELIGATSE